MNDPRDHQLYSHFDEALDTAAHLHEVLTWIRYWYSCHLDNPHAAADFQAINAILEEVQHVADHIVYVRDSDYGG